GPLLALNAAGLSAGGHAVGLTVTGQCGSASHSATLTVQPLTTANGPSDAVACLGADVNFATAASGTAPFTYEWSFDGNAVGTNGPSLTVGTTGLSLGDHTVKVVVGAQCGVTVTNTAGLKVQDAFAANGPFGLVVCQGADANFETTPSGTGPFSYQCSVDAGAMGTNGP